MDIHIVILSITI